MRFWASQMARVMQCAAFKALQEVFKRPGTFAAGEGTAAAALAEQCLKTDKEPVEFQGQAIGNFLADQEMVRYMTRYVHACKEHLAGAGTYGIEDRHEHTLSNGLTLVVKPDFWFFDAGENCLNVFELKYGRSWVEPFENWQMLCVPVVLFWNQNGWMPAKVKLTVHQPRGNHPLGPVRSWTFNGELLRNYANRIQGAMERATLPDPIMTPGKECWWCPVATDCRAGREMCAALVDFAQVSNTGSLTPEMMAMESRGIETAIDMLKARQTALEETMLHTMQTGVIIPGFESRQSFSNLVWRGDGVSIGDGLGKDFRAEQKAITPTQAIDRDLITEAQAKYLTERKPGAFKLKQIDLKRVRQLINGG